MNSMQRSRLSTPRDYLALIVRRKWMILFTLLGCLGVAMLAASIIPNVYVSESLILFQPGEVSTDLVKEIANGTTDERLTAIQETILSRSNLRKVVRDFEGEPDYQGLSDEKKVDRMRSRLEMEFLSEKVRNVLAPITHVRIKYRAHSPELAQKITARLASLFIEQENRTREDQVYGTSKFLKNELTKVTEQLGRSGERLKAIKERYKNQLPSQLEANMRTLDRLQQQKAASAEALDRQTTLQITLERQLSQISPMISSDPTRLAAARIRNPLVEVYFKKQAEYKDVLAKATDRHPDVIRLRSELDSLRASIPSEDLESAGVPDQEKPKPKTEPNPLYQSLAAQLSQVRTEIEIRKREKRLIDAQMNAVSGNLQNTPRAEQDIAATERANADLSRQADDLRAKLEQAKLAEIVESKRQNSQFVVIDHANLPDDPESPNRLNLRVAGILLSLGIAFVVGLAADLSKRTVFTSFELERLLKTPVLVEIPRINSAWNMSRMRRMRMKYAAIFLIGAGLYGLGLYHMYTHPDLVLRVLDPLIQTGTNSNAQK